MRKKKRPDSTKSRLPLCNTAVSSSCVLLKIHTHCSELTPPQEVLLLRLWLVVVVVADSPETHSVPVAVEGLQVLLIVDPLSAAGTHRQTSSGCGNRKKRKRNAENEKTGGKKCVFMRRSKSLQLSGARQDETRQM